MEDAKRLEGIVDEEVKGESDVYSVVAEEERKQELAKELDDAQSNADASTADVLLGGATEINDGIDVDKKEEK